MDLIDVIMIFIVKNIIDFKITANCIHSLSIILLYFHYYQLFEIKHFQFQSIDNVKDEGQW